MIKTKIIEGRRCPKRGKEENQTNNGYNKSGTQRCGCKDCKITYTPNGKQRALPEELRNQAMKIYLSGVSGRGVGKILDMNKSNVYNWLKKTGKNMDKRTYVP
jgi:transposase-like protein